MARNTINTVTKPLPPHVREAMRELWTASNLMDLNYISLADYIRCITQRIDTLTELCNNQEEAVKDIKNYIINKEKSIKAGY